MEGVHICYDLSIIEMQQHACQSPLYLMKCCNGQLGPKIHVTEAGSFITLDKFISLINYSMGYTSTSSVTKYKSLQRFHHEPHVDLYRCILSIDSFILFSMQFTQWNIYKDLSTSNSQPPLLGILYPLLEPHHQNWCSRQMK